LFDKEDDSDVSEGGVIAENNRMMKKEFQKMWGWHELLHTVCDYMFLDMLKGMEQPAIQILTYATLLKHKEKVVKK